MSVASTVEYDTERAQGGVRLVVSGCVMFYVAFILSGRSDDAFLLHLLSAYFIVFIALSCVLLLHIVRRPGVLPWRRLLSMLHDYLGITVLMSLGGELMLPVYGVLLWITVGNGLRFGPRYLALATVFAVTALLCVTWFSPYWRQEPYMVITLLVTTLIVPGYVNTLMAQTRRATEAERAANLAKTRFLAQASHDLRQPIHSISLFTACLRGADLAPEQRQMIDNIDKSLLSVSQLFRSILDMYTLDGGKVSPRAEVVPLQDVFEALLRQNAEAARWAGVEIRLRPTAQHVFVDPGLLTTLLQNLVSNALKYAPGKPVLIGCRRRAGSIAVDVYDQGRGIAPQHLGSVFDEFYRVRQVRDRDIEGVGLGLAIVRRLSRLMGLEVRIRSVLGKGTVAAIEGLVPVRARAAVAVSSQPPSESPRLLDGLRVCLVEDDRNVLLATATLLQKWGCSVETHTSIPTERSACDLVITDFDLGTEASGADCIQYLRQLNGRDIPAVVITGHDVNRVQAAIGDPGIPILAKPIHPAELRSILMALKLSLSGR